MKLLTKDSGLPRALLVFVLAVGLAGDSARAQDTSEITALYGRGVHAFFAGQVDEAETDVHGMRGGRVRPIPAFTTSAGLHGCVKAGNTKPKKIFRLPPRLKRAIRVCGMRIGNALQRIQGPERVHARRVPPRRPESTTCSRAPWQLRARYEQLQNREKPMCCIAANRCRWSNWLSHRWKFNGAGSTGPSRPRHLSSSSQPLLTERCPGERQLRRSGLRATRLPRTSSAVEATARAEPAAPAATPAAEPAAEDDVFGPAATSPGSHGRRSRACSRDDRGERSFWSYGGTCGRGGSSSCRTRGHSG